MGQIEIRAAVPSDLEFVRLTMAATLRDNSAFCKGVHPATMASLIEPVLAVYQVAVATTVDDRDTVVGFIVYRDESTVAFLYVRSQFRSKRDPQNPRRRIGGGIGRALLAHAQIARAALGSDYVPEIACAFMVTKIDGEIRGQAFGALAESKGYRLRFRPYLPLEITARVLHGAPGRDAE